MITKSLLVGLTVSSLFLLLPGASGAEAPATFKVSEFTFKRPSNWEWIEVTSPMRKAQLKVVDPKNKQEGEVVFFAGFGGTVKENVERWFRQFEEGRDPTNAKSEEVTVNNRKVTYASAQGTYLSGPPGGTRTPLKNHALLGAIIESNEGNVFIRLTGPADLVKQAAPDFKAMVEGVLKTK